MNSITLICSLKNNIDSIYRQAEYALPSYNDDGKSTQDIVLKYWTNTKGSRLTSLNVGTHIAIRGHIDHNDEHGTIVIVEQFEII